MLPTTKKTLRFRPDGSFRILMVSDIQDKAAYDPRTLRGLHAMIEQTNPDLVIWGGDNVDGRYLKTYDELRDYLHVFTAPMEQRGIPWMHVYGNHDYDVDVDIATQHALYCAYPHCISGTNAGIPGMSNYAVPILAHEGDATAFCIYAFDTMHKNPTLRPDVPASDLLLPNRPKGSRKWDMVRFEQQMWYWQLSCELERREGHLVPAMAVMHVPPHEIYMTVENPEETGFCGEADEKIHCPVLNSGVYATMLQRGDVGIIAAGHLHRDTAEGVYGGIRLTLDACAGFAPSGDDARRGGRVFDLREDGTHRTHMIFLKDLMDITV